MKHQIESEPGIFKVDTELTDHTFSWRIIDWTGELDAQNNILGEEPPLTDDRWVLMYHVVGSINNDAKVVRIIDPPLYTVEKMDLVFCVEQVMLFMESELLLYDVEWAELERMKRDYDSFRNTYSDYGKNFQE